MKQIKCPFCGHDVTNLHGMTIRESAGVDFGVGVPVFMLCTDCGEPLVVEPKKFRKPTPDEHVLMMSDKRLSIAREAWMNFKRNNRMPPITEMWEHYYEHSLQDITSDDIHNDYELMQFGQDVFLSGVGMALALFKKTISAAKSSEDFSGRMALIEAELKTYAAMRKEDSDERRTAN